MLFQKIFVVKKKVIGIHSTVVTSFNYNMKQTLGVKKKAKNFWKSRQSWEEQLRSFSTSMRDIKRE